VAVILEHWSFAAEQRKQLVHNLQQISRSEMELHEEIKQAYWRYNWLKKNNLRCDTWLGQLVEAQAEAYNKKKLYSVTKDWQVKMSKAKLTHNDAQFSIYTNKGSENNIL